MKPFTGRCVSGPWRGKDLAHTSKTKVLLKPMMEALSMHPSIEAIKLGEYRLNNYGIWHWWEER